MSAQCLDSHLAGFVQRDASCDAAREIREVHAKVAVSILAQNSDIGRHRPNPKIPNRASTTPDTDTIAGATSHRRGMACTAPTIAIKKMTPMAEPTMIATPTGSHRLMPFG